MKKIGFLLLLIFCSCQTEDKRETTTELKRVTLSYSQAMSYESLIVHVEKYRNDNIDVSYKYIPPNGSNPNDFSFKSYNIDSIKFNKIVESILKIDRLNIEKESQTNGTGGISTGISFYEKDKNTIMNLYSIWNPDSNTEERKLNNYMNAYNELVKLAFIKPDTLF